MDRHEKKHTPLSTTGSVVDPAAEAAHRHLSWTPEGVPALHPESPDDKEYVPEFGRGDFVSYTGFPDNTFEITVTMQRGETVSTQAERGVGETAGAIQETLLKAYEKADRALLVITIGDETPEEVEQ